MKKVVALSLAFVFVACNSQKNKDGAAVNTFAQPGNAWKKAEITTCWAPNKFEGSTRFLVQRIIERQVNDRTPYRFTGWKACSEKNPADVVIDLMPPEDKSSNAGGIGVSYQSLMNDEGRLVEKIGKRQPMQFNFTTFCAEFTKEGGADYAQCIRWTAVHEFGHVLGLRHEHARKDSTCNPGTGEVQTNAPTETTFGSAYDPRSIMDYCWILGNLRSAKPLDAALSQGDLQGILKLAQAAGLVKDSNPTGPDAKPREPINEPASEPPPKQDSAEVIE